MSIPKEAMYHHVSQSTQVRALISFRVLPSERPCFDQGPVLVSILDSTVAAVKNLESQPLRYE